MHLSKAYSPVLDCHIWRLQQFVPGTHRGDEGKWWQISFTVFNTYPHYDDDGRTFVARRVQEHRRALRFSIANHLKEQARVQENR